MAHETNSSTYPPSVEAEIDRITALPIVKKILDSLNDKLPSNLKYHDARHTENVVREAIYFAVIDGLSPREMELLGIAAAYHDAGFLVQYQDNEEVGAEMAVRAMRDTKRYTDDEVQLVKHMILDTQLIDNAAHYDERPSSNLSRYLLDADMSNLGRQDFFDKVSLIVEEFGVEERAHLEKTLTLVTNHCWLTPAAKALRREQKEANISRLREMLGKD